jgi:hypothetical protein
VYDKSVYEQGEGNFVGDFPQPNIGGATVKPMQVGDTVTYFGQTAKIQAQSPDRKHSRIEITKGTGGVVQTVLTSDLKRVHKGMAEEFRPTTGQAMGIRSQTAQKMNPDNSKFVWKRPNQIMGSHSENELRALKFRYSTKHNVWGGTQQMWSQLEGVAEGWGGAIAGAAGGGMIGSLIGYPMAGTALGAWLGSLLSAEKSNGNKNNAQYYNVYINGKEHFVNHQDDYEGNLLTLEDAIAEIAAAAEKQHDRKTQYTIVNSQTGHHKQDK